LKWRGTSLLGDEVGLTVAATLGVSASPIASALELYVDTQTKQIYAEPGPHRQLLGNFEKVEKAAADTAETLNKEEIKAIRQNLATKDEEIKALQKQAMAASGPDAVQVKMDKKGLQFETQDKNFKFRLGGRIHADANFSDNDQFVKAGTTTPEEANDGTEIRRARILFEGTFYQDWNFRTQADFANDNVRMKDLYIKYTGLDFMNITAGQQKQNFSRELQESSNDLMFTERSLMNVLNAPVVDRAIGLNFQSTAERGYYAGLGVYGNSITPARTSGTEVNNAGDEGWGISGRAAIAPIEEATKVLYFGAAGNYRVPDDSGDVSRAKGLNFKYETTNMSNLDLIDIDIDVEDVDNIKMVGAEAGGIYGPFSVGAEYTRMWIEQDQNGAAFDNGNNGTLQLEGWYVDAAWTLTGESRKYKHGKFYKVSPERNFSLKNGGWGAWELATRYSAVNLDDGAFKGGKISNATVALNWYFNDNFRLMADYIRAFDISNPAVTKANGGDPDDVNSYTLRLQLTY